ncbi:helix-turn-helix transcriptional regulator [Lentibacillus cibarius]|uniref:Helix-turn-helix transcriptional regulator n=1 Tax=Lentibacillus cibarius TaxID=2583219 RepID=A0A549YLZ5_9BACI|nr:helix-turn-helix transcriptional regulator [Lentibacillus cibarius]TRM08775.1 helix-turn-helix transcriptional regulator [Lentibacillus cibarius]TRM08803.1 helix-turn-helix transcriptional regulator [Lentibacillus cibarius]TRM12877.1 helix-turn-helix transcriptional regulator [Lentibacillus cibarius]
MGLGERLKLCRNKRGYSQKEVAEKIGVKNNTLSSYESGARSPDYDTLTELAEIYDTSIDYLLRGEERIYKNMFFFDMEGLSDDEIKDIKRHIEYVKWKSRQEKGDKNE